jgi:alkylhydroperoxidase family enzyme
MDQYGSSDAFSVREKAVLTLVDWMAHGTEGQIDAESLKRLQSEFSTEQIVELGTYFAIVTGFQKFNTVFRIRYRCED